MKSRARQKSLLITYGWIAVLAITVIVLIYWELTAVLYILATLGVTGLLIVVAFDDLGRGDVLSREVSEVNDAAAIGSGITTPPQKRTP